MNAGRWPESQAAWHLLAARLADAQRAERAEHWAALMAQDADDAHLYQEPMSPEEEETLF